MKLVIDLAGLALALGMIAVLVSQYRKATSTGLQRVWDAGRGSATIVWSYIGLIVTGLTAGSGKLADLVFSVFNDPAGADAVKTAINSYVTPTTASVVGALFIAVTIWARSRTL